MTPPTAAAYSRLEPEKQCEVDRSGSRTGKQYSYLKISFCAIIALWNLALVGIVLYVTLHRSPDALFVPRRPDCNCGSTLAEAKRLGCRFDTLSVTWLPPHCIDAELSAEFDSIGDGPGGKWQFWADQNATQVLTVEEVSMLGGKSQHDDGVFYTNWRFHVAHCSFYWRKDYRMRARGWTSEDRYDRESHVKHCHWVFMKGSPYGKSIVRGTVWIGGNRKGQMDELEHSGHGSSGTV